MKKAFFFRTLRAPITHRGVHQARLNLYRLLLVVVCIANSAMATAATPQVLHVSPAGVGNACSTAKPCGLDAARNKVRQLRTLTPATSIEVQLAGGEYLLDKPFILEPEDSGVKDHPTIWRNQPGATPVISSGIAVTHWSRVDAGQNIWMAPIPAGVVFRALYVNGKTARRAWSGYGVTGIKIDDGVAITNKYDFSKWRHPRDLEIVRRDGWRFQQCPVEKITQHSLSILASCQKKFAIDDYTSMYPLILSTMTSITTQQPALENAYELLDTPGEWYLDQHQGKLYYLPKNGEKLPEKLSPSTDETQLVYPRLTSLWQLRGTKTSPIRNISVQGLTFRYTDAAIKQTVLTALASREQYPAGAMQVEAGQNISVNNNLFLNIGRDALHFDIRGDDIQVNGNGFGEIGNVAISLMPSNVERCCGIKGGTTAKNLNAFMSRFTISNNTIVNTGTIVAGAGEAIGILYSEMSRDLRILHNNVINAGGHGIAGSWFNAAWLDVTGSIEYGWNLVINSCSDPQAFDNGAMYVVAANKEKNSIHDNVIEGVKKDCHGIYIDIHSQNFEITRNVIKGHGTYSLPYISGWLHFITAKNNIAHHNWTDRAGYSDILIHAEHWYQLKLFSSMLPVPIGRIPPNKMNENTLVYECSMSWLCSGWPKEAQEVMRLAGVQPEYASMRQRINLATGAGH